MAREMKVNKNTPSTKTTASAKKKREVVKEDVQKDAVEIVKEDVVIKEFNPEDRISCKSVYPGRTYIDGVKSKNLYEFTYEGDIVDIEYRDLEAYARSNSPYLFKPFIIVNDEGFINKFSKLKDFYSKSYYIDEPKKIFELEPNELEDVLPHLPVGTQEAVRSIASTMIAEGKLDSVAKIKILDDFFDTQLMLLTGLYE